MQKLAKPGDTSGENMAKRTLKQGCTPLYALHFHIYRKFFDEQRLKRDMRRMKPLKACRRALEIVEKEGYEDILEQFRKRIV